MNGVTLPEEVFFCTDDDYPKFKAALGEILDASTEWRVQQVSPDINEWCWHPDVG